MNHPFTCLFSEGGSNRYPRDIVPDINITGEDGQQLMETSSSYATCDASSRDHLTLEEHSAASPSPMEHETETSTTTGTLCRSSALVNSTCNAAKKKLRLRKMGSRQNSKTESDSSDADTQSVLETPRRMRRKNFRLKQRSLDDDFRMGPFPPVQTAAEAEDIICSSLKVKPGERIEESQSIASSSLPQQQLQKQHLQAKPSGFVPPPLPELHERSYNTNANVFVKTKRKLFTTVLEPTAAEGIALIEKELESPTLSVEEAQPVKSKITTPRPLSLYKSISLERLLPLHPREELRRSLSLDSVRRVSLTVRPPLASDSMKRLARSKRQLAPTPFPQVPPRRGHLFKKNSLHKSQSATVSNNIEHKIAKTSSGSTVSRACPSPSPTPIFTPISLVLPNKLDNTLPRIQRKWEGKGKALLTPTKPKQFEFPEPERPATPLSERALRLQQAKAQFLQSAPVTPRQEATTPLPMEDVTLHKSVSVGSMRGDSAEQAKVQLQHQRDTEATTDQESISNSSAYDSLPRSVSRSGRISSKLGFATLASKLRRGGKKSKDAAGTSAAPIGSALSTLCRQTLLADVIALPTPADRPPLSPGRNVHKSQSSPQAATGSTRGAISGHHNSSEGINKSLSEQYVRQLKESDV